MEDKALCGEGAGAARTDRDWPVQVEACGWHRAEGGRADEIPPQNAFGEVPRGAGHAAVRPEFAVEQLHSRLRRSVWTLHEHTRQDDS